MASRTSLRVAIVGPRANFISSSILATRTPDGISIDMPSASTADQKPPAGTPRYRQVTTPTRGLSKGRTTSFKQSGSTHTSLSVITRYGDEATSSIFSSANTFAFGQVGSPEKTTRVRIFGYFLRSEST